MTATLLSGILSATAQMLLDKKYVKIIVYRAIFGTVIVIRIFSACGTTYILWIRAKTNSTKLHLDFLHSNTTVSLQSFITIVTCVVALLVSGALLDFC